MTKQGKVLIALLATVMHVNSASLVNTSASANVLNLTAAWVTETGPLAFDDVILTGSAIVQGTGDGITFGVTLPDGLPELNWTVSMMLLDDSVASASLRSLPSHEWVFGVGNEFGSFLSNERGGRVTFSGPGLGNSTEVNFGPRSHEVFWNGTWDRTTGNLEFSARINTVPEPEGIMAALATAAVGVGLFRLRQSSPSA